MISPTLLERYAQAGKRAGVHKDQLKNFLRGHYVAQPKQLEFHAAARLCDADDGPTQVCFGGARGPGKTHAAFAQLCMDDCQRYPGLKALFLRKVGKAAKESISDLRLSVLRSVPHRYHSHDGVISFPNGSRIVLGHYNNENEIDNYLGVEYDVVVIEEGNTLSESKHKALGGSIRTSKLGWRPRRYLTVNPGRIGHAYIKKTFVQPFRTNTETLTRFIPASWRDNAFLKPEYIAYLKSLTGLLGRMWRDGDWDVAGGQYFTNWNYDRMVDPLPKALRHWRYWLAMDYGWSHYTVIYLLAADDQNHIYVIDEHGERQWLIEQHARAVTEILARWNLHHHQIHTFVAGHDCFSQDSQGHTIAAQWQRYGWTLTPAATNRIQGAATITRLFGSPEQHIPATITIADRCANLIETIPNLLSDSKKPEDVLKEDVDADGNGGDDWYDAFRYGVMASGIRKWSEKDLQALAGRNV